jgi:hypothetical protein
MKKLALTTFLSVSILFQVFSQSKIVINEIYQYMAKGEQTGFEVLIPESTPDRTNAEFAKLAKKYKGKVVTQKKSPDVFVDDALVKEVSENTIDMYYVTSPINNGTKLTVFVDLGGAFISSSNHPRAYDAMENFLRKFGLDLVKSNIQEQIKLEEKNLSNLEKELNTLFRDKDSYIKEIEKAKALIAQREQDILNNEDNQTKKTGQIEIQKEIISTIKSKLREFEY